ncbi:SDR family NAD(P)-dependent oxidoreductase [Caulobacter sp. UC70_42]|uniref:SDR family NAD(P)-dependent oxidoreductase n=1 Tax=Caulobacter sp. UC70_42 TaxID=3374551 RepID=UPI003758150B
MPKTWFITGATSGLGLEMARQLLPEGHTVIATARRPDALAQLRQDHPARLDVVQLDLLEPGGIASAIESAFDRHKRIDVIVSNAGYGLLGRQKNSPRLRSTGRSPPTLPDQST